jgi:basic membrane protein A
MFVFLMIISSGVSIVCGGIDQRRDHTPSQTQSKRVALLLPGLIDDQSWNQALHNGLKRAEKAGVRVAYTERVTQDQQIEVFRNYARRGFDVIIGGGGEYLDAAMQVAGDFPKAHFVVANATKAGGNVTALAIKYSDMGYLAGVLAARISQSRKVALVSGQPIPISQEAVRGFKAGAARGGPAVQVNVTYTGSFDDVQRAREAALALISDGADVVWHLLDAADVGVLTAAEDRGAMVIGLYTDQSKVAPNAHIGAVLADPSILIYEAATGSDRLDGNAYMDGIAKGVVTMGAFSPRVPEEVREALRDTEAEIRTGKTNY